MKIIRHVRSSGAETDRNRTLDLSVPQLLGPYRDSGSSRRGECSGAIWKTIPKLLVYLNDYQLVPLNRISRICADLYGYRVSEDTILKARQNCYERLEGFEKQVKERLTNCAIVHADETGLKVNAKNHWLHTVCNKRHTFLGIHPKRGYQALEDFGILEKYAGRLVHDCWATYFRLKNCQHSLCNPHLIRELVFAQEQLQQQWAAKMRKLLQEAYEYGKVWKAEMGPKSKHGWHVRYGRIIAPR